MRPFTPRLTVESWGRILSLVLENIGPEISHHLMQIFERDGSLAVVDAEMTRR